MSRKPKFNLSDPYSVELAKIEVSRALQVAVARRQWSQRDAALQIGTSQGNLSRALNPETAKKLTFNQLFRYLSRVDRTFRVMVDAG